ncbi:hypothetical protein L0F63_002073, partial [Massospora cicadina]
NGFTPVGKLQVDLLDRVGENAEKSIEGWTIGITGIHREATEEDVLDRFAEFGEVKTLHLNLDRHDGYVKGYALVEYEFFDQAKEAVAKSDGAILLGQELRANLMIIHALKPRILWRVDLVPKLRRRMTSGILEADSTVVIKEGTIELRETVPLKVGTIVAIDSIGVLTETILTITLPITAAMIPTTILMANMIVGRNGATKDH